MYSGDPLELLSIAWMVSPTLFTDDLLHRIRHWREECLTEHPKCRGTTGPQPLPSRVIDIPATSDSHTVSLRVSRGERGVYAALSYCWGACSQRTTTKSTLKEHLVGIKVSTLPGVIRDAIRLCQSLGIPHLWVDALCIVQDDWEDWHHEAAEMAAIYGRSALTISAPQNTHCDESFDTFPPTKSEVPSVPEIAWQHRLQEDSVTGSAAFQLSALGPTGRPHPTFSIGERGTPWMTRGWTLQEWLLSPRVLHCGRQRVWDCYQTWYTESGMTHDGSPAVADAHDDIKDGLVPQIFARLARLDPDIRGSALDTHWARLVEDFTSRNLTREMDKMPAVAGLAAKFMEYSRTKALQAKYLAGLWYYRGINPFGRHTYPTSQVPMGLLWRRSAVEYMRSPAAYRAPSWSWAALDGQVNLFSPRWLYFTIFGGSIGFEEIKLMEVNTAGCLYNPPDSCSLVETGWIVATTYVTRACINPFWKVELFHPKLREEYHKTFIGLATHRGREDTPFFGIFDQSPEQTGIQYIEDSLYLLHVATVARNPQKFRAPDIIHYALVAERVGIFDNMDCFHRLGMAWYSPSKKSELVGQYFTTHNYWSDRHMLRDWESRKVRLI